MSVNATGQQLAFSRADDCQLAWASADECLKSIQRHELVKEEAPSLELDAGDAPVARVAVKPHREQLSDSDPKERVELLAILLEPVRLVEEEVARDLERLGGGDRRGRKESGRGEGRLDRKSVV